MLFIHSWTPTKSAIPKHSITQKAPPLIPPHCTPLPLFALFLAFRLFTLKPGSSRPPLPQASSTPSQVPTASMPGACYGTPRWAGRDTPPFSPPCHVPLACSPLNLNPCSSSLPLPPPPPFLRRPQTPSQAPTACMPGALPWDAPMG